MCGSVSWWILDTNLDVTWWIMSHGDRISELCVFEAESPPQLDSLGGIHGCERSSYNCVMCTKLGSNKIYATISENYASRIMDAASRSKNICVHNSGRINSGRTIVHPKKSQDLIQADSQCFYLTRRDASVVYS